MDELFHAMNKSSFKNKLLITRYFLITFLIIGSILAGTISILYNLETKDYISQLEVEERVNVRLLTQHITSSMGDVVSDLKFLSGQNELLHMFESGDESYGDEIAREYLLFSRQKNKYDQIRFIDDTGMEKVRVNFNNGDPALIPESDLQSKGSRYYFRDTIGLSKGEIFVSPLDLNKEKGEIEKPLKPMIRFGVPVFDNAGRKRGIVILNYLGDRFITPIRVESRLSYGDIMLVNSDGYWLCSPNEADEWGFMIEERKGRKFSTDFPEEWGNISSSEAVQISNAKGLFTSATVYPFKEGLDSGTGSSEGYSDSEKNVNYQEYYWKIISYIPDHKLRSGTRGLLVKLFFLTVLLFLFAAVPSWFIAQSMARRKLHQAELYRSANYDKLTDLPNRSLFLDRLNQVFNQSKRYERKFALLFIDLDGFKSVNDTFGHDAGDELLIKVAEKLLICVRESDTVARLGGDEFTVILSTIESSINAEQVAGKIIETLAVPFTIKGNDVQIGASIGVSIYPDNGDDTEILLKKADDAMYLAKKEGKNDYRVSA